jgi:hypothetical protein
MGTPGFAQLSSIRLAGDINATGLPDNITLDELLVKIAYGVRGQGIPRRVPQHVRMDRERQVGNLAASLDHTGDAHTAERPTPLIHKHMG